MIYAAHNPWQNGGGAIPRKPAAGGGMALAMRVPAVILVLAVLLPACTLMPPKGEQLRARQMENAVLPMASTALESGQVETARRLYQRLLGVDPESVSARMGLGRVALRDREPAAAARWFLAALSHAREPAQRHEALLAHGRAALAAGQVEAAGESFARLVEAKDNPGRASLAWGHNGVGLTRLLSGDLPGAVASLERAVLLAPEERRFQGNLGRALAMQEGFPAPARASEDAPTPGPAGWEPQPPELTNAETQSRERAGREPQPPEEAGGESQSAERPGGAPPLPSGSASGSMAETSDGVPLSPEPDPLAAGTDDSPQAPEPLAAAATDASQAPDSPPVDTAEAARDAESLDGERDDSSAEPGFPEIETTYLPQAPDPLAVASTGLSSAPDPLQDADSLRNGETALPESTARSSPAMDDATAVDNDTATLRATEPQDLDQESSTRSSEPEQEPAALPDSDAGGSPAAQVPGTYPSVMVITEDDGRHLQFGAYAKRTVAEAVADSLGPLSELPVQISETSDAGGTPLHRVRIGPVDADGELWEWIERFESLGYQFVNPAPASAVASDSNAQPRRHWNPWLVNVDGERYLQAGAYRKRGTADSVATELRGLTGRPVRISAFEPENGPTLHRVRIGPLEPNDSLSELLDYPQ